jgi:hypothetical protein
VGEELPPSLFNILREDNKTLRIEVNGRLDGLARDMVTSALFSAYQASQKGVDERQDARIKELEADKDARDAELRRVVEEQRKTKAQLLTSIGLAVFGVILSVIGGVTIWTIQNGLSQLAGS